MTRRGTILLSVLVIVSIGAMVGTTMLMAIDAERGSTETALRHDRLRSLAWSGIQGVMAELSDQRDDLLTGARPMLTRSWEFEPDALGRRGVVRLVVLDEASDSVALAEPGKLDLNHASASMLAALDGIDDDVAQQIVQTRKSRPFTSVEELLLIKGVSTEMVYGPLDEQGETLGDASSPGEPADTLDPLMDSPMPGRERLIDVLTVFSADPNVTAAWDDESHRGEMRINLNLPWSDRLGRALANRFSEETAAFLEAQYKSGVSLTSRAALLRFILRIIGELPDKSQLYEEILPTALDSVATSNEAFVPGRIDINAAPARVLATIPGIDIDHAEQIVLLRDELDEQRRQTPVWPLIEGVLTEDQFIEAADWMTTRSLQWRVRVEAGYLPADEQDAVAPLGLDGLDQPAEARLDQRLVFDVVIDVGSTRPRVAYLRDMSLMAASRLIARERPALLEALTDAQHPAQDPSADELDDTPLGAFAAEIGDVTPSPEAAAEPSSRRSLASENRLSRPVERPDTSGSTPASDLPGTSGGLEMVDHRIGRWTSRRGGR